MPVGTVAVRVVPRSSRQGVSVEGGRVVVRVRAVPEGGRATEEARRALAAALHVPPSHIALRSGSRSRNKFFEVDGFDTEAAVGALGDR